MMTMIYKFYFVFNNIQDVFLSWICRVAIAYVL